MTSNFMTKLLEDMQRIREHEIEKARTKNYSEPTLYTDPLALKERGLPQDYKQPNYPSIFAPGTDVKKVLDEISDQTPIQDFKDKIKLNAQKYNQLKRTWEYEYSIQWWFKKMFNRDARPFFPE